MAKLPIVSGREAMRAFGKVGYVFSHSKGSHHHKELRRGTLNSLLRSARMSVEEFISLL